MYQKFKVVHSIFNYCTEKGIISKFKMAGTNQNQNIGKDPGLLAQSIVIF